MGKCAHGGWVVTGVNYAAHQFIIVSQLQMHFIHLLCNNGAGPCKYFSFADWRKVNKPCQSREGTEVRRSFLPGIRVACWPGSCWHTFSLLLNFLQCSVIASLRVGTCLPLLSLQGLIWAAVVYPGATGIMDLFPSPGPHTGKVCCPYFLFRPTYVHTRDPTRPGI